MPINQYMLVMFPRPTNRIVPTLNKINEQTRNYGWTLRYVDFAYVGSASTDAPLAKMYDRAELVKCLQYAFNRCIDHTTNIKDFKIVTELTPLVLDTGMGFLMKAEFIRHLSQALGFKTQDEVFMVLATPGSEKRWAEEDIRAAKRIFEDPEDGQFKCEMHPSQWSIGIINKSFPEIMHAVIDLEYMLPEAYITMKLKDGQEKGNVEASIRSLRSDIEGL